MEVSGRHTHQRLDGTAEMVQIAEDFFEQVPHSCLFSLPTGGRICCRETVANNAKVNNSNPFFRGDRRSGSVGLKNNTQQIKNKNLCNH